MGDLNTGAPSSQPPTLSDWPLHPSWEPTYEMAASTVMMVRLALPPWYRIGSLSLYLGELAVQRPTLTTELHRSCTTIFIDLRPPTLSILPVRRRAAAWHWSDML